MLGDQIQELMTQARAGLSALYGDRLRGLYLFGSHARGEAGRDSDVDLLVVLDEVSHYYGELQRSAELVADLALEFDVSVSRVFLPEQEWRQGEGPFLATVRQEAIAA